MQSKDMLKSIKKNRNVYFLLAPWLIVFIVFTIAPIFSAVTLSFSSYNILQPAKFNGFDNYLRLFLDDDVFILSLKNTAIFAVITGPVGYLLSFIIAWMINDMSPRARSVLTLLFYSPTLAGNVYFIWLFIFSGDSYGLINSNLLKLGAIKEPVYWLTDPKYNFWVCVAVLIWMSMGAGFLALVAGFKQLNFSLFEAAAIDGIRNRWQELWFVTLPQMVPQLLISAVLSVSGAFAVGYQCAALTGFPSTDYSTHTMVLHIQDYGYNRFEMGYASAIAVVLFVLMIIVWNTINKAISSMGD